MSGRQLIVLLLLIPVLVSGQFEKLINYTVKDGLPNSEVYSILQDSKGYIWSSGDMGVSRFNGYEFKNFSMDEGLADHVVFGMYQDAKDRLWFLSFSGRLSFFKDEHIYSLPCNDTLEKLVKPNILTSAYVDAGDTIWIGLTNRFFLKINPGWRARDVHTVLLDKGKYFFMPEGKGLIFGGSAGGKQIITAYDQNQHALFKVDVPLSLPKNENPRFFLLRLTNGSFMASLNNLLVHFNSTGILQRSEEENVIICITELSDHTVITGGYSGESVYAGGRFNNRTVTRKLHGKIVTGLLKDTENGFWRATEGQGLYYQPFRNFLYYTVPDGIPESKISFMSRINSTIATGHYDNSICLFSGDSLKIIPGPVRSNGMSHSGKITSICSYNHKAIAVAQSGVFEITSQGLRILPQLNEQIYKKFIRSRNGTLLGLNYGWVNRFDPVNFRLLNAYKFSSRADNIYEDREGNLWLSSTDGMYLLNKDTFIYLGAKHKLLALRSPNVSEASDGSMWLATRNNGILIKKGEHMGQITDRNGLAGKMCRCIFIDSNTVWVGTNKGVSRITPKPAGGYAIDNFDSRNGLLTNEVNTIVKHNGKLWFAHSDGISVVDVEHVKNNTCPPPIHILETYVNDSLRNKENLMQLTYDQNYITIKYMGLCYKAQGHVEYKYKMEGIDSSWAYTGYTSVNYRTIPPGIYRFLVYARNNDGYWSAQPATVTFRVLPAWWQTALFKISAIAFIIVLAALFFKLRLNKIRLREREKALLQSRMAHTELQALRAQMNPHFIFNAINSVQSFITGNDPVSSQRYLSKFAKLIRYVVDHSKPDSIPLKTELGALQLYLELEALRFGDRFTFSIEVDASIDAGNIKIPSMIIQPYVENAIWHGLMHKQDQGNVSIRIVKEGEVLKCVIRDNGIGRTRSQQINRQRDGSRRTSIGMSNTRERLDIISQINAVKMKVTVTDVLNEAQEIAGTCVELTIYADYFNLN